MNMKKTKVMYSQGVHPYQVRIGNNILENVEEYIYLGQEVRATPGHEREVKRRIGMGWGAFGKHSYRMATQGWDEEKRQAAYSVER